MTRRHHVDVPAPALGGAGAVIAYGHCGRPFLVFPSEQGRAWDFESNGMVDAVRPLLDAGRVEALLRHLARRGVLVQPVALGRGPGPRARRVRAVGRRLGGAVHLRRLRRASQEIGTIGCSMGAYHALNFALRRADLFPLSMCFSGNYDPSAWHGWGEQGEAAYFTNPIHFVARPRAATTWSGCGPGCRCCWWSARACGRTPPARCRPPGAWPGCCKEKGIRCELDLWGHDVPHDWPSWQRAARPPPPRFC